MHVCIIYLLYLCVCVRERERESEREREREGDGDGYRNTPIAISAHFQENDHPYQLDHCLKFHDVKFKWKKICLDFQAMKSYHIAFHLSDVNQMGG